MGDQKKRQSRIRMYFCRSCGKAQTRSRREWKKGEPAPTCACGGILQRSRPKEIVEWTCNDCGLKQSGKSFQWNQAGIDHQCKECGGMLARPLVSENQSAANPKETKLEMGVVSGRVSQGKCRDCGASETVPRWDWMRRTPPRCGRCGGMLDKVGR